jgi:Peptidase family M28
MRVAAVVLAIVLAAVAVLKQPVLLPMRFESREHARAELLREHVVRLTSQPRCANEPDQARAAAEYIADAFRASGGRVSLQWHETRGKRFANVIAEFGPRAPRPLIVGAHYDTFCETGGVQPGADDNASGTAGLLELARLLGAAKHIDTAVMLAAYSTEEPPFFGGDSMGSAVHARSLRGRTRGMINLEMIGYYAEQQRWPTALFELLYPTRGDFIAVAGRWQDTRLLRHVKRAIRGAGGIRVASFIGPRVSLDASDHRNYWDAGHKAVVLSNTGDLRNPYYHSMKDTADTLDYERMAHVIDGVLNAVLHARGL